MSTATPILALATPRRLHGKDQATGLDLYGYTGAIARVHGVNEAERDALDSFDRRADALALDVRGDDRVKTLVNLAVLGLMKNIAPTEILNACSKAQADSGYLLSDASVKQAVQIAIKRHMEVVDAGPVDPDAGSLPFNPAASRVGDVFTAEPPAPKFIVDGFLPVAAGQENAIGGAGKTTRRMWEGIHIILGRPLYGRPITQPGPVLVVTKEDGSNIFKYRLHHVAAAMDLSDADRQRVAEHFHVLDMSGDVGGRLIQVDRAGNLHATDLADRICAGYRREGMAQVSFDPWGLFGPGERFVNDAEASLMAAGAMVSRELACNVCYVGHVSKAVGRQGIVDAHSGRGGAAMGDNARFVLSYVQHVPGEDREWAPPAAAAQAALLGDLYRLHITKQSYAKRQLEPIWIERKGYAFTVHEGAPIAPADAMKADGARVKVFVQQELAQGAKYQATPLARAHERYALKRDRARAVIGRLLASGELVRRDLPEAERSTQRTHFLEPVFKETATAEALFQG